MLLFNLLLICIIIGSVVYYKRNRKKIEEQIEKNYLKENREKLYNQLKTEKQSIEDGLLLEIDKLRRERDRLTDIVSAGEKTIEQLEKRKAESMRAFEEKKKEQEEILSIRKQEQLSAIDEVVAERKKSVDTDVAAYREVEMEKARTAGDADTQANREWAEASLTTYWDDLAQTTQEIERELSIARAELEDHRKKQQAINEAILRQRAIEEQQDFYRVCLSQETVEDVQILQNIRQKLHFSESLNKLIYDNYISKPAKEMIKRVLGTRDPSGVYKITRLKTGEVYIGQAMHLPDRWQQHLKTVYGAGTIARSTLHITMQKDGVENFTFEMVEEVPKEKLREREKYWIDFYQSKTYGMNERNG